MKHWVKHGVSGSCRKQLVLHRLGQRRALDLDQMMNVIVPHHTGKQPVAKSRLALSEQVQMAPPVPIVGKDRLPLITATHRLIERSGEMHPRFSCHRDARLRKASSKINLALRFWFHSCLAVSRLIPCGCGSEETRWIHFRDLFGRSSTLSRAHLSRRRVCRPI